MSFSVDRLVIAMLSESGIDTMLQFNITYFPPLALSPLPFLLPPNRQGSKSLDHRRFHFTPYLITTIARRWVRVNANRQKSSVRLIAFQLSV
jgi:hypothetical protein